LLNIIDNRLFPSSGKVLIDGEAAKENDKSLCKVYMMSEELLYPKNMKVKNIFKLTKDFYPNFDIAKAKKFSDEFGLDINSKIGKISTGYTTVVKLIIGLSVNTPYVIFDEPVIGLDANNRELFYKLLLEKYIEEPCTIVLSTHIIDEISTIIENVVILNNGKVIVDKTRDELLESGYSVSGRCEDVDNYISDKELISADVIGKYKTAYILGKADEDISDNLEVAQLDLQKLFIKLTNQRRDTYASC
jgi:ABC-2 type transport system ATP-binding protein